MADQFQIVISGSVLQRSSKHFTLDVAGQKKVVSLDRLKPAYMDIPQDTVPDSLLQATTQTQSQAPPSSTTTATLLGGA